MSGLARRVSILLVLLTLTLMLTGTRRAAVAQPVGGDSPPRLDLAAMALTAGDLADAGLAGATLAWGEETVSPGAVVRTAGRFGQDQAVADLLDETGWVGQYVADLYVIGQTNDPGAPPVEVSVGIVQFAGSGGARRVFDARAGAGAFLLGPVGLGRYEPQPRGPVTDAEDITVETVGDASATSLGDVPAAALGEGVPGTNPRSVTVATTFRTGGTVASVTITTVSADGEDPAAADPEAIGPARAEALAARLLDRIGEVEGADDSLGSMLVQLDPGPGDDFDAPTALTVYRRLAGETTGFRGGPAEAATLGAGYDAAGVEEALLSMASVQYTDTWSPIEFANATVGIHRLADADRADAYLTTLVEEAEAGHPIRDAIEGSMDLVAYEVVAGAETFGDESVTLSRPEPMTRYLELPEPEVDYALYARAGDYVVYVDLAPNNGDDPFPPIGGADSLAAAGQVMAAQVACLEAGACPDPVALPVAGIFDPRFEFDVAAPLPGSDPATPAPLAFQNIEGSTFASPSHGLSVTWDEADWDMIGTFDQDTNEGFGLTTGTSDAYVISSDAGGGGSASPRACLGDFARWLEGEGAVDVEVIEAPRVDGDVARATYGNGPSVADRPFLVTIRCESFDAGASMLAIYHLVPEDAAEAEGALLDALIEGLEVSR